MARYSFILSEENRGKLIAEGLNIEVRLLDKKITFDDYARFYRSSVNCGTISDIGAFSYSRTGANLLKIGNYCSINNGVTIMGGNHPYERFTTSTITYQKNGGILGAVVNGKILKIAFVREPDKHLTAVRLKKFRIGSDVHIRANCVLANNLVLSTGCCVEEESVVVKDVPPYAIVAGNPAQIVGYRFEEKIIEKLLETHWTEYDISTMEIRGDISVEEFIDKFYEYRDTGRVKPIILKNLKEVLDKIDIPYATV